MTTHHLAINAAVGFTCLLAGIYLQYRKTVNRDLGTGLFTATGIADLVVKTLKRVGWLAIIVCIIIACCSTSTGCSPITRTPKPSAALAPVAGQVDNAAKGVAEGATGNRDDAAAINHNADAALSALGTIPAKVISFFDAIKAGASRISNRSDDFDRIAVLLTQQSANIRAVSVQVGELEKQNGQLQKRLDTANSRTQRMMDWLKVAGLLLAAGGVVAGLLLKNVQVGAAIGAGGIALSVMAVAFGQTLPAITLVTKWAIFAGLSSIIFETLFRKWYSKATLWQSFLAAIHTNPLEDLKELRKALSTSPSTPKAGP